MPFSSDNSSRTSQHAWILTGVCTFASFHPYLIVSESVLIDWYSAVARLISSNLDCVTENVQPTRCTCRAIASSTLSCTFERQVLGRACQGGLAPFLVYIPTRSHTSVFSVEFFVILVICSLGFLHNCSDSMATFFP